MGYRVIHRVYICMALLLFNNRGLDAAICRCTRIYLPVCGVDGVSYGNKCMAECNTRALPRCAGRCPCGGPDTITNEVAPRPGRFSEYFQQVDGEKQCSCGPRSRQVCGTDGQTYSNPCVGVR